MRGERDLLSPFRRSSVVGAQRVRLGFVVLLASACSDRASTQPEASSASTSAFGASLAARADDRRHPFDSLARLVPGFSSVFLDESGRLTIATTSGSLENGDKQRVRSWAQRYAGLSTIDGDVRVTLVRYDHLQLSNYYAQLGNAIDGDSNVTSTGIDGARGKLVVGVRSARESAQLRTRLQRASFPDDLVDVEEQPMATGDATLSSRFRPLIAGLRTIDVAGAD